MKQFSKLMLLSLSKCLITQVTSRCYDNVLQTIFISTFELVENKLSEILPQHPPEASVPYDETTKKNTGWLKRGLKKNQNVIVLKHRIHEHQNNSYVTMGHVISINLNVFWYLPKNGGKKTCITNMSLYQMSMALFETLAFFLFFLQLCDASVGH